jgi:hypothetical protein
MARKIKLVRYKWYIVDVTIIKDIFAYRKGFLTQSLAKDAIDAYLEKSSVLRIMTGSEVELNRIPTKKADFSIHKPNILRRDNVKDRINNYRKRERIKGNQIVTHQFKKLWEPMPSDAKARKALLRKGRDRIRNFILK